MGNVTFLARGTFLPTWIDPKDKKFYYRHKPIIPAHQPYLGEDCDVVIGNGDLIDHGFHLLTEAKLIRASTRDKISRSVWVKQAWGGDFSFNVLGQASMG